MFCPLGGIYVIKRLTLQNIGYILKIMRNEQFRVDLRVANLAPHTLRSHQRSTSVPSKGGLVAEYLVSTANMQIGCVF